MRRSFYVVHKKEILQIHKKDKKFIKKHNEQIDTASKNYLLIKNDEEINQKANTLINLIK